MVSDPLIVGRGVAGSVAALRLAEAGRRVRVVADGEGATAMSSGAFDPHPGLDEAAVRWLCDRMPGVLESRSGMRVACASGAWVEAVGAPFGCLDRAEVGAGRVVLLDVPVAGGLDAAGVAGMLSSSGGVDVIGIDMAEIGDPYRSGDYLAGALCEPGDEVERVAGGWVDWLAASAPGGESVLLPCWTPRALLEAVRRRRGPLVHRLLGVFGAGGAGVELSEGLRAALGRAGVEVVPGRVVSCRWEGDAWRLGTVSGEAFRSKAVVLATGGVAGGGIARRGFVEAVPPVGELRYGDRLLSGGPAPWGHAPEGLLPDSLFDAGSTGLSIVVRTDDRLRVAGAAPGLWAAGGSAGPSGGVLGGLGWALASGWRAASEVEFLLREGGA
jgi:glycine/D-amino acid oxidase-like deaminating enzyme